MENKKFLYIIIAGLAIFLVIDEVNLHLINKYQSVVIRFCQRILVLPNDYYVDNWGNRELTYRGKQGWVVLSKEMPADTLEYFESHLKNKSEKCGMKMSEGQIKDMKAILLFEGKASLLFMDVPVEVETAALKSLCEPRKVKASRPVPGLTSPPTP